MFARQGSTGAGWFPAGFPWALAVVLVLSGCGERERLTFGPPPNGVGPRTFIDVPGKDTTVTAGPDFFIFGTSVDSQGVDTVYFETVGGVSNFPPFHSTVDTIQWGLPLTTGGLAGETITVRAFATDGDGNRGDTAIRHIAIE
jgi:hypothetical protein